MYSEFVIEQCNPYYLDLGSLFAASVLPLENAEQILDMCAAPGGKSLVLASRMKDNAYLTCNERSQDRRNRLINVLNQSLTSSINNRITITASDGALICKKITKKFDSILLDAPCSSERHVFNAEKYLEQWTAARIKNLSFTQWSLLSSAFLLLNENGYLLYSTCALSPTENDGVIQKLIKKYDNCQIENIDIEKIKELLKNVKNIELLVPERTTYGYHILPDKSSGAGPMYFCLIKKTPICID